MRQAKKGFVPVMMTPFRESGAIDFDCLTQLTQRYLEAGATGLFANCLSSEMFQLNENERIQIVKHIVQVADGIVPVVATGTFGGNLNTQADFVKKIYECGVEAVIAITNMLARKEENDTVLDERLATLLEQTPDIPMGLYECPSPYKRTINASQLKAYTDTGRIIYLKDTCLDIEQVKLKLDAAQHCRNFGLYDAYIVHAVESLYAGSAGLSCIQGNYWPELIVWICNNYNNPDVSAELLSVMTFLKDNMELMHNSYPASAKYYLKKTGLPITTVTRQKNNELSGVTMKAIDKLDQQYLELTGRINMKYEL